MILLRKLIDFVLYSNLFIAIGAASLVYQTLLILQTFSLADRYAYFIFFATIFIYSAHRLIGFSKLDRIANNRRINLILQFQKHISLYALIGLIGLGFNIFYLSLTSLLWLCLPGVLALLYILPIFGRKRRFRDLPFVKIFTIGLVWVWTCAFIPIIKAHQSIDLNQIIYLTEKLFFIIGITLPFDIRDMKVDRIHHIVTIPIRLGEKTSKLLSKGLILMSWLFSTVNFSLDYFSLTQWIALTISYLITGLIIESIGEKSSDYFFTGLLDGTILLQFILLWVFS